MHFTPASASWLDLVERLFSTFSEKWVKLGAHIGVKDLGKSIQQCLKQHNKDSKPFVWRKSADAIIDAVGRTAGKLT